jgi:hypothetical protein
MSGPGLETQSGIGTISGYLSVNALPVTLFRGSGAGAFSDYSGALNVNVSGGTISANVSGNYVNVAASGVGISHYSGALNVNISGGTISANVSGNYVSVAASGVAISHYSGALNVNISGGTISANVSGNVVVIAASGGNLLLSEGTGSNATLRTSIWTAGSQIGALGGTADAVPTVGACPPGQRSSCGTARTTTG